MPRTCHQLCRFPGSGHCRLSVNQEHLWNLDQMIPGTHFFNMPYVYHLRGDLNLAALEKTLREIVRRHEALRTVFTKFDGRPVQIIKDGSDFQLSVDDLRSGRLDEVSQQAAGLILEERERPFDLATGPLFRTKLLRIERDGTPFSYSRCTTLSVTTGRCSCFAEIGSCISAFSEGGLAALEICRFNWPTMLAGKDDYWKAGY